MAYSFSHGVRVEVQLSIYSPGLVSRLFPCPFQPLVPTGWSLLPRGQPDLVPGVQNISRQTGSLAHCYRTLSKGQARHVLMMMINSPVIASLRRGGGNPCSRPIPTESSALPSMQWLQPRSPTAAHLPVPFPTVLNSQPRMPPWPHVGACETEPGSCYQLDMGICESVHSSFCPVQASSLQKDHKLLEGGFSRLHFWIPWGVYGTWPQGRVLGLLLLSCALT